jgi:hypothetical protein
MTSDSSQPPPRAQVTFWAQVEPTWTRWLEPASLRSIHVRKVTQRRPARPAPGCVLVKLTITLPKGAFVPPVLEGRADVPPDRLVTAPVEVEAGQP